jgi:heavy metal translocating P-type ATPase
MECCETDAVEAPRPAPEFDGDGDEERSDRWDWVRIGIGALFGGNAMVVGLAINLNELASNERLFIEIALLGATVVVFELLGRRLLRKAIAAVKRGEIIFEFLFLSGIFGAVGASVVSMVRGVGPVYFEVACLLLVIYAVGDRVGRVSRREGLAAARAWAPDEGTCRVRTDCGHLRQVPLAEVEVGQTLLVDPEEVIPVDARIVEGSSFVRDAHITGEFFSTVKRPGDTVWAGSTLLDGSLTLEATAVKGGRMIDAIRTSVEEAWERPSRWQEEANRIVQWFFPAVVALTLATFGVWATLGSWEEALFNGLAVLLIACPCALGFAVPLAVWMTLGDYASRGLVARGGDVVERLAAVDTVVFDKTGTLTASAGRLVDFVAAPPDYHRADLLAMTATLEEASDHPVARAFVGRGQESDSRRFCLKSTEMLPGAGISGVLEDRETGRRLELAVGTEEILAERWRADFDELADRLEADEGVRRLAVALDGRPVGAAAVAESPHRAIDATLEALDELGLGAVLMTGDRRERAERLGFETIYAEVTPDQKASHIEQMQRAGRRVLYVGDGVNDAAAMARADVGIAVAEGSEITVDVADMTWHGSEPRRLVEAIEQADRSVGIIRQNLWYALGYNVVGIAAAAAGLLHPVLAALLMVGSSSLVTWRTTLALDNHSSSSSSTSVST